MSACTVMTKLLALSLLAAVTLGCGAVPGSADKRPRGTRGAAEPSASVDYERLAEHVIGDSAAVREGDLVQVLGTTADSELMEALALAIRQRGAFALLTLTSDRLEQRYYERVPDKYDDQPPTLELALAEIVSVIIELVPESDEIYPGVPPERIARVFASRQQLHARHRERGVRQVYLGNELYPSRQRADRYGIPYEVLERNYWRGLATDAATIAARAAWARDKLSGAQVVEVTNPNGTHLTMSLAGKKLLVSDGMLSAEEIAAGGAEVMVWLPAGELFVPPVAESVHGTVVVDRLLFQDTRVEGLRIDFVSGRVAAMTATSGLDSLKRFYDAAGPGKDRFSALDIGINPNVEHVPGAWLTSPVAAGMITLGIGRNTWAGGDNDVSFGVPLYLPTSTLVVDGYELITDGVLQIPSHVNAR
jgi:aminopeptidase